MLWKAIPGGLVRRLREQFVGDWGALRRSGGGGQGRHLFFSPLGRPFRGRGKAANHSCFGGGTFSPACVFVLQLFMSCCWWVACVDLLKRDLKTGKRGEQ